MSKLSMPSSGDSSPVSQVPASDWSGVPTHVSGEPRHVAYSDRASGLWLASTAVRPTPAPGAKGLPMGTLAAGAMLSAPVDLSAIADSCCPAFTGDWLRPARIRSLSPARHDAAVDTASAQSMFL